MSMKKKTIGGFAVVVPRKRPAAASSIDDDDVQVAKRPAGVTGGDDVLLKKPAMALLKRPASAAPEDEEEEEEEAAEPVQEVSPAQDAREAIKVVQQQQRLIRKLSSENEKWADKIKANKSLLRKAEKELDGAKEVATKKARKLGAIHGAKLRKQMLAKKNKAQGQSERAVAAVKVATKRYNTLKKIMNKSSGRSGDVESAFKRAQNSYEDAKKLCAKLKKEGEHVPDEGEKDLSASFAWKPPGVKAAKARDVAKVVYLKAKATWDKAAAPNMARQERLAALKEKVNEAKLNQQKVEEAMAELKKGKK